MQEGLKESYTIDSKEIKAITSLNGLTVSNRIQWSHMDVKHGIFMMEASDFALGVALKLQLEEATIQNLCRDAKFGHKVPSNSPYDKPKQRK